MGKNVIVEDDFVKPSDFRDPGGRKKAKENKPDQRNANSSPHKDSVTNLNPPKSDS